MMPTPPRNDNNIEEGSFRLDINLLTIPMDNRDKPLPSVNHLTKLFKEIVVPLEHLTVSMQNLVTTEPAILGMKLTMLFITLK